MVAPVSDPRHFTRKTKRLAFKRCNGICEYERPSGERCGMPVGPGNVIYDHVDPWHLSRDSSLANCAAICVRCDRDKTFGRDIPLIADIRATRDFHLGITGPGKGDGTKLQGGRSSRLRKTVKGRVIERQTQSQRHWAAMARRYGGFA